MAEKKNISIPTPVVKVQHIVKPAEPTPNHAMYLSGCDQIQAITHAPTVYFYHPSPTTLSEAAQKMKESLSKALVAFYPIAGRIKPAEKGRMELHCNGEGALLVEAESEARIEDYGNFMPTPELRQLIPTIDLMAATLTQVPLLLCQVTKFKCGGICVGMGICHSIGDGQSCLHFIAEWCKICRGESETVTNMPYLDRGILEKVETLAERKFHHPEFDQPPLLNGKSDAQLSRLEIAADIRSRLNPKLPERYFGNTILRVAAFAKAGDLVNKPLSYAASKLRERNENITDEYIKSYLALIKTLPDVSKYRNFHTVGCTMGAFNGNPNLECTSWMGLPMFGADWGWGKEIHMGPAAVSMDGKLFILPAAAEGDGSLNVCIRLQVGHMEAFQKYFYEDM